MQYAHTSRLDFDFEFYRFPLTVHMGETTVEDIRHAEMQRNFQLEDKNYRIRSARGQSRNGKTLFLFAPLSYVCNMANKKKLRLNTIFKESNSLQRICYLTLITPIYTVADYHATKRLHGRKKESVCDRLIFIVRPWLICAFQ